MDGDLEQYDPDLHYKPGKDDEVSDIMSRRGRPSAVAADDKFMKPQHLYSIPFFHESEWSILQAKYVTDLGRDAAFTNPSNSGEASRQVFGTG